MADDSRQVIVERVVAARKEAGLNQSQLAKQMGAGKTTIQRYEDIESVPSAWERLRDMGEILKRTPGYLIGASDIHDLELAVGQYFVYYKVLQKQQPHPWA